MDEILEDHDFDPGRMLQILESTQHLYGYLPVGALKRIAHRTGAWYAMIYGTASYYRHLRFEPAEAVPQAAALAARRPTEATYLVAFENALTGSPGGRTAGRKTAVRADGRRRRRSQA